MIIGDIRVLLDCLITFKCLRTGKLNSSLRGDETAMTQHQCMTQRHPGHSAPANSEGCRGGCRGSSQCPERRCHWKKETKGNLIWRSKWSQCAHSRHQGSWGAGGCLLSVTSPPLLRSARSGMENRKDCLNRPLTGDLLRLSF